MAAWLVPLAISVGSSLWLYRQLVAEIRECTVAYERLAKAGQAVTSLAATAKVNGTLIEEHIELIDAAFPHLGDVYRNPCWDICRGTSCEEATP